MSGRLTYSIDEAAEAIGVGRGSAYELVRRGNLRTVRVGRRVLVPRDAVLEFLGLEHEQEAASPKATPEPAPDEVTYLVTIRRVGGAGTMNTPFVSPGRW
jgi:excisionase family DNA binding protein